MNGTRIAAVCCVLLATLTAAPAQEVRQQSPITPGFWSWPRQKLASPQAIEDFCKTRVAVQFADGRYFGFNLHVADKPSAPPSIDEVGTCRFDRARQVERCELKVRSADGKVTSGVMESRYASEPDGALKMTVKPTQIDGGPSEAKEFDVFPVRCPDDAVWKALNGP